jgi:hypothetical protein
MGKCLELLAAGSRDATISVTQQICGYDGRRRHGALIQNPLL